MIKTKNLLCVKRKDNISDDEKLLYEPYKNILIKFKELCVDINAKTFDPISQSFDGLLSVPKNLKEFYVSLLGVTSFYQHSQGGKGKYLEKKLASFFETASLDIRLSELPLWLEKPKLHKKRALLTLEKLHKQEKQELRSISWDWLGKNDVVVDIGCIHWEEQAIVLCELKKRIDSGGTAARREVWTSKKFGIIAQQIIEDSKIFRKNNQDFSLIDFLNHFNIQTIEIYLGILFDKTDRPATIDGDRESGFFSTSKEGLDYLNNILENSYLISKKRFDRDSLYLEIELKKFNSKIIFAGIYGDQIPLKLFRREVPVSELLLLMFDDIWFSQILAIDERMVLLKYKTNYTSLFLELIKKDKHLQKIFKELINTECEAKKLNEVVDYLLNNYSNLFEERFLPNRNNTKEEHLADVIQLVCAAEA